MPLWHTPSRVTQHSILNRLPGKAQLFPLCSHMRIFPDNLHLLARLFRLCRRWLPAGRSRYAPNGSCMSRSRFRPCYFALSAMQRLCGREPSSVCPYGTASDQRERYSPVRSTDLAATCRTAESTCA